MMQSLLKVNNKLHQCYQNIYRKKRIECLDNILAKERITNGTVLNLEQKRKVNEIWGKYIQHISYYSFAFYLEKTQSFSPLFVPDAYYYYYIDMVLNNWDLAKYIDNKCYYPRLFEGVALPSMIGYRINGYWYDETDSIVGFDKIIEGVFYNKDCFIKKATESYGGKGVFYFRPKDNNVEDLKRVIEPIKSDIVIQKSIKQSDVLAKLSASSVNTIRVISLLRKDGSVKIYSIILRMGIGNSKVDNASSGGITCGVRDDGRLKSVAYSAKGVRFDEHPTSHVHFDEIIIPSIEDIKELVYKLHPKFPHFRLVSWDVALDVENKPVLIEANLHDGEVDFHQLNNGPLFKDDTMDILNECFESNK